MFGHRELGRLDNALLTCAAEAPDGTVYVGCSGARYGYETLSAGRWPGTYAPALLILEDGAFIGHGDFDSDDRWVDGVLADDTGVWAAGGILGDGAALWRIEDGDVVHEIIGSAAAGTNVAELAWLDGMLYTLGNGRLGRVEELGLTAIALGGLDPESSLAALGERLYWLTEDGETAWMQGTHQEGTLSRTLPYRNAHAIFQDRLWALQADDVIGWLTETEGTRIRPQFDVEEPYQELAWYDGTTWRTVARWPVNEAGMYARVAAFGGHLWLFGEMWDPEAQEHAEQPCVGLWDGETLRLAEAWPYWVDRINASGRRALMVGDDGWYGQTIYPGGQTTWRGPGVVIAAGMDVALHAIEVEVGDGTGETPAAHDIRIEVGDGSPETPHVLEVRLEAGQGSAGPTAGEKILWLTDSDGGPCVGLRVTTGETWETDVQVRGIVRAGKEHLDVDDWGSYQPFALNEQVSIGEPGVAVRIGLIVDDSFEGAADVVAQLLREDA